MAVQRLRTLPGAWQGLRVVRLTQTATTGTEAVLRTYHCAKCGHYLAKGRLYEGSFLQMKCPDRHCRVMNRMTSDGIVILND